MSANVEIEILSHTAIPRKALQELENALNDNENGLKLLFKKAPVSSLGPVRSMAGVEEVLVLGLVHAAVGIPIEIFFAELIKPKIEKWIKNLHSHGVKIPEKKADTSDFGVMSSIKTENYNKSFHTDAQGHVHEYDHLKYSLNPDRTCALLIGTSEYTYGFLPIASVKGNIDEMWELLTGKRYMALPEGNVAICLDKTDDILQKEIKKISRKLDMDTLIFYYAGHGHRDRDDQLYLTCTNTDIDADDGSVMAGLEFEKVKDLLNPPVPPESKIKQKIIIIDACHSGIAAQNSALPGIDADIRGSYTLTSSAANESSYYDTKLKKTDFTAALADVIRQGLNNSHEYLSLQDLYENTVKAMKDKKSKPQQKSDIKDIHTGAIVDPAHFFILANARFSYSNLKPVITKAIENEEFEAAETNIKKIRRNCQDNLDLLNWATEREDEIEEKKNEKKFLEHKWAGDDFFWKKGQYENAATEYRAALTIKPYDKDVRKYLADSEAEIAKAQQRAASAAVPPKASPAIQTEPAVSQPAPTSHLAPAAQPTPAPKTQHADESQQQTQSVENKKFILNNGQKTDVSANPKQQTTIILIGLGIVGVFLIILFYYELNKNRSSGYSSDDRARTDSMVHSAKADSMSLKARADSTAQRMNMDSTAAAKTADSIKKKLAADSLLNEAKSINNVDKTAGVQRNIVAETKKLAFELNKDEPDIRLISQYIKNGAKGITKAKNGNTALLMAAMHNNTELALTLLQEGADADVPDDQNTTALYWASQHNNLALTQKLVSKGADINRQHFANKNSILFIAARFNSTDVARFLISKTADLNAQDNAGNTPLHEAILKGSNGAALLLIESHANLYLQNNEGETPVILSAREDRDEVSRKLIDLSAINVEDNDGWTPLMWASHHNNLALVRLMLAQNVQLTPKTKGGSTAYDLAKTDEMRDLLSGKTK